MPLYRASLRALGAVALLALALACKGKGGTEAASTTVAVGGKVTYLRVPLVQDVNGVPTGLADSTVAANLKELPARGQVVRAYQRLDQTLPDGSTGHAWVLVGTTYTDSTGVYSINVPKNQATMVELLSSFTGGASAGTALNIIAEPGGIQSTTVPMDRLRYALRKAADGSAPAGINAPYATISQNAVVNFTVSVDDAWWVVDSAVHIGSRTSAEAPFVEQAQLETSYPDRASGAGSGSRISAIGDTAYSLVNAYGTSTPPGTLDLHYWMGRTEPEGSFIEFDRSKYPQAYDSYTGQMHYFGSLAAGSANDDAWDEGVILPLLARGVLYGNGLALSSEARTFVVPLSPLLPAGTPLANLSPEVARIEGLAEVMAANLLKSPYLADTQGTGLATPVKDIRDVSGLTSDQRTPYSAPAIRAFAWEVILKANRLPSPGLPSDWANINPLATTRFFLAPTSLTGGSTITPARDADPLNIFNQVTRLQEAKASSEPVDLASIFTNDVLTALASPFGLPWPRPTSGPYSSFVADWGTDPNAATSPLAPVALSMAKAVQVNGVYPNLSQGEVFYAGFNLNADKRYVITVAISPALDAGASLDLDLPRISRTFTFTGAGGSTEALVLPMSASTAPYYHPVRLRLKSPGALQPDVAVTVSFNPAL